MLANRISSPQPLYFVNGGRRTSGSISNHSKYSNEGWQPPQGDYIFVLRLKRQHEIPRVVAEILHPFELFQNTNGSSRASIYHHQPSRDINEF